MALEVPPVAQAAVVYENGEIGRASVLPYAAAYEINQALDALVAAAAPVQIGAQRVSVAPRVQQYIVVQPDYRSHFLNSYSYFDSLIQLEDGSFWQVRSYDMYKILNWASNDPLSIYPNSALFGSSFIVENSVTRERVEVDFLSFPFEYYFSPTSHWVIAIDDWLNLIYLENGTCFSVRGVDSIANWSVNDQVIIGNGRNEWFGSHDSILINETLLGRYVYANQSY